MLIIKYFLKRQYYLGKSELSGATNQHIERSRKLCSKHHEEME